MHSNGTTVEPATHTSQRRASMHGAENEWKREREGGRQAGEEVERSEGGREGGRVGGREGERERGREGELEGERERWKDGRGKMGGREESVSS